MNQTMSEIKASNGQQRLDNKQVSSPTNDSTNALNEETLDEIPLTTTFKPLRLVLFVLFIIIALSQFIQWYSLNVSMPRYCENPKQSLKYLEKVLTENNPAGNESRRPYLIAAKLIYLLPRQQNETLDAYLERVHQHIFRICHQ